MFELNPLCTAPQFSRISVKTLLAITFILGTLIGCGGGGAPHVKPPTLLEELNQSLYVEAEMATVTHWTVWADVPQQHQWILSHLQALPFKEVSLFEVKYRSTDLPQVAVHLKSDGNTKLMVYAAGHGGEEAFESTHVTELLSGALRSGFDLLLVSIPLNGFNKLRPEVGYKVSVRGSEQPIRALGYVLTLAGHSIYELMSDRSNYVHYFVDGSILPLRADLSGAYEEYHYVGHSGGASAGLFACSLFAFKSCILQSGFLPEYLRLLDVRNMGDIEQLSKTVFSDFSVENLLELASARSDRLELVYNNHDSCCFGNPAAQIFKDDFSSFNITIRQSDHHDFDSAYILAIMHQFDLR